MIGWRIPAATICLLTGVMFTGDPLAWWRAVGGVFLVFVPALIVDHVVTVLDGRMAWRRVSSLNNPTEGYRPVCSRLHFPTDRAAGSESETHSDKGTGW